MLELFHENFIIVIFSVKLITIQTLIYFTGTNVESNVLKPNIFQHEKIKVELSPAEVDDQIELQNENRKRRKIDPIYKDESNGKPCHFV